MTSSDHIRPWSVRAYCDSYCSMQLWAWAVYILTTMPRSNQPPVLCGIKVKSKGNAEHLYSTLHGNIPLKLTLDFFSWPKSIYYCDVSLTNCTFIKLELRVLGTHFYGDAGEYDGRRGINLGIWSQWLYHGTDDKLVLVVTVASIVTGIIGLAAIKLVNKIKLNVCNDMCLNYLDSRTSVW